MVVGLEFKNRLPISQNKLRGKGVPSFPDSEAFLTQVVRNGLPDASASPEYAFAQFGRDSEKYAFDSLQYHPEKALPVIVNLAKSQGTKVDPVSEEEPGKIIHEHREYFDSLPTFSKRKYRTLKKDWSTEGNSNEFTYFGSADATPLFISLVARYCERVGSADILDMVIDAKGKRLSDAVEASTQWLEDRIINGPLLNAEKRAEPRPEGRLKLLEFRRMNERKGIDNQNWKDSGTSLVHENGMLANHLQPIATIDLQGYAYDALMDAAKLLGNTQPEVAQRRQALAREVRDTTLQHLWLPDKGYFAVGLDRDKEGNYRQIKTSESNPAEILTTGFFDELSDAQKQQYVGGIVNTIYSKKFLTDVGIRCRSLSDAKLTQFVDYHGSFAVWAKNTSEIAKGLERQGFDKLSKQLKIRVLNGIRIAGSFQELFYVTADGKISFNPKRTNNIVNQLVANLRNDSIKASAFPEENQTWTGSAVNEFEDEMKMGHPDFPVDARLSETWNSDMDKKLFEENPIATLIDDPQEAATRRRLTKNPYINIREGRRLEAQFKKTRHQRAA